MESYLPEPALIISCEHGGNRVPVKYKALFKEGKEALSSHRGYDPGALAVYNILCQNLPSRHLSSRVSRLLVELNRSLHHPNLFSEFTRTLPEDQKRVLLASHYHPYRNTLTAMIETHVHHGTPVLHLSVHSFVPELNGQVRNADIGLLYDPGRRWEKEYCHRLKNILQKTSPLLRVRFNYPYLGKADGLTTWLRKKFPEELYAGIELEVNQALLKNKAGQRAAGEMLLESIHQCLS